MISETRFFNTILSYSERELRHNFSIFISLLLSDVRAETGETKGNILFQTRFTNDTDDPQEYTLKTEKRTMSSCDTVIEESFTKGVEMSVNLKTPCEIFEANAGSV